MSLFWSFLRLGLMSFGGPVAHIGYFRQAFVVDKAWLSEAQFAQLVAMSHFLPGPSSSQLGFAIGWCRAGGLGALLAFVAFTTPSALLMLGFALLATSSSDAWLDVLLHGLKLVALVIVSQALWGMFIKLCPDARRRWMALAVALLAWWFSGNPWLSLLLVAMAALVGSFWLKQRPSAAAESLPLTIHRGLSFSALLLFAALFAVAVIVPHEGLFATFAVFYQAGALVFGGGHVVLPLLEPWVVQDGLLTQDQFMAGYGAAQALPGPMFSLAAYIGALLPGAYPFWLGALVAILGVFLPGFLLLIGVLPYWLRLSAEPRAQRAVAGVNAAVVGLLAATWVEPVALSALQHWLDGLIALTGFAALQLKRVSPLWIVLWCALASAITAWFGG